MLVAARFLRGLARFPLLLVAVDAFDEGASGLPASGAFALADAFQADITALNAAVFVVPLLLSLFVDGPLLLFCERFRRERVLAWGLAGMGLAMLGCALAPNLYWFAAAFSLYAPASGLACGIAQAALMDADPERREQRMTEWAAAGWLGDLAGPLLLWASAALGLGLSGAFSSMGVALLLAAIAFSQHPLGDVAEEEEDDDSGLSFTETLRLLSRQRLLLVWLVGVMLCSLLDEIVAALAGLRIDHAGGGAGQVAVSLFAFTAGGVVGLLPMKALLARVTVQRVLAFSCAGCFVTYLAWLLSPTSLSAVLLFLTGLFTAPHYPLAQAQAYRALPGRSTLVAAAGQPFVLFDIVMPLGIGWVADAFGLPWALAMLALQPVGLVWVCWLAARSTRGERAG